MSTDRTLQSIADVLAANEQHLLPRDPNRPELHWRDIAGLPTPRPVPSPEDRMRDARQPGPTFATYLDRQDRDQLDARAATAEQERGDALDDRDFAREQAKAMYETLKKIERERNEALEARDCSRQLADFRQGVIDRHRQELGAAGEVLAVVRDAAERIDRALVVYDTTPGEAAEREDAPHEDPSRLREQLAEAHADCARYATERDEARAAVDREERAHGETVKDRDAAEQIADSLAGAIAKLTGVEIGEHSSMNDPWQNALQAATEAAEQRPAPSSVPPRRAQEPQPGQFCAKHFSWLCQAGQGRCQAEARP